MKHEYLALHSLDCSDHFSCMSARPEFKIPYTLPGSCSQAAIGYWNRDGRADKSGFYMCLEIGISFGQLVYLDEKACAEQGIINRGKKKNQPAYHPPPQHYVDTNHPSYPPAQSYPTHHSYPPLHPYPNSHSATTRSSYAARTNAAIRP